MKLIRNSGVVIVLALGIIGTGVAYLSISQRHAHHMQQRQERLTQAAREALTNLDDLPPTPASTPAPAKVTAAPPDAGS